MSPHTLSAASLEGHACPNDSPEANKKGESMELMLPPDCSFPPITDDGQKPNHKYWWENGIRHSLSMHKEFIKIKRPIDDPGLGSYWIIQSGKEYKFLEKPTRKSASTKARVPPKSFQAPHQSSHQPLPTSQATVHRLERSQSYVVPSKLSIPLPGDSSSPIPIQVEARNGTLDLRPRASCQSSATTSHLKRKLVSTNLASTEMLFESSQEFAPTRKATLRKGRAEEEIARIRGSAAGRSRFELKNFEPSLSSFMRQSRERRMNSPLTAAKKVDSLNRRSSPISPSISARTHRTISPRTQPRVSDIGEVHYPLSFISLSEAGNPSFMSRSPEFDIFQEPRSMHSPLTPSVVSADADSLVQRSTKPLLQDVSFPTVPLGDITNFVAKKPPLSIPPARVAEHSPLCLGASNTAYDEYRLPSWSLQTWTPSWDSPLNFSSMFDPSDDDD